MSLRTAMLKHLPGILPDRQEDAMNAPAIVEAIKPLLERDYAPATIRFELCCMSTNPSSPVAKVDEGQGYYLNPAIVINEADRRELAALRIEKEKLVAKLQSMLDDLNGIEGVASLGEGAE